MRWAGKRGRAKKKEEGEGRKTSQAATVPGGGREKKKESSSYLSSFMSCALPPPFFASLMSFLGKEQHHAPTLLVSNILFSNMAVVLWSASLPSSKGYSIGTNGGEMGIFKEKIGFLPRRTCTTYYVSACSPMMMKKLAKIFHCRGGHQNYPLPSSSSPIKRALQSFEPAN